MLPQKMILRITLNLLIMILFSSSSVGTPATNCGEAGLSIAGGNYTLSDGTNLNSVVMYKCPDGYYPFPSGFRHCRRPGKWLPELEKNKVAECKIVACPDPSGFEHGSISPNQMQYFVNNVTTYKCFDGYTFYGSATRVCQANGKWSGFTPICDHGLGHCPDPGVPPGTRRTGRRFGIDDKVTYRCDQGLRMVGSNERICQGSSEWTGTEPGCYYKYTYDTPEEVKSAFSVSLNSRLELSKSNSSNITQYGKKVKLDAGENLHIYFALDASDSVLENNFISSKECVQKLIEKISYYEITPKYEILAFATEVTDLVDITAPENKTAHDILEMLKNHPYDAKGDKSGTNIALVFSKILGKMGVMRVRDIEGYKEVRNVIIIFTDGVSNMGGSAKENVEKIKQFVHSIKGENWQDYLDIYAFAVGPEHDLAELNELVSKKHPEKHLYLLENEKLLEKTFDEMIDEGESVGLCGLYRTYGKMTMRSRYPWLVQISVTRQGDNSNCLGSLISGRFVLTAAHCFKFGDRPESVTVTLNVEEPGVKIKMFKLHPQYDVQAKKDKGIPEFYDYDVALIELKNDVTFSVNVRPICIPCTKETSRALGLSDSAKCKDQEEEMLRSDFVQASFMSTNYVRKNVTIKLGDRRPNCIKDSTKAEGITAQDPNEIVTENFLCTGGIEEETNHIACKGDSGGGLFVEKKKRLIQVGVTSWGVMDLCKKNTIISEESSRDFHINLFKVQPFLREYLTKEHESYAPTAFID